MTQISAYQDAPYQGISQAPPQVRRRDQAEALEDYLVAIPEGAQKRPPFQFVAALANHPGSTTGVFHHVERLAGDAIYTLTREGSVTVPRVYSFPALVQQALTIDGSAQAYLNSGVTVPQHDIGTNTIADYTFTWNRQKSVSNSGTTEPTRPYEAMVWVRAGQYGKDYTVGIAGLTVGVHTPDGTSASDSTWVDATKIASALHYGGGSYTTADGASVTNALTSLPAGFTVTQDTDVLYITGASDFQVDVFDGQGGVGIVAVKDQVQHFSDLPKRAPDGFTVRIIQQSGTNQDDYYVKYDAGTKTWVECLAPGAQLGLDKLTMPMGLVYDGGWKLNVLDWKQRTTGNEELVKDPDFIGQAIQDVTFWQGRLGLIAGEGVTLSCADDPFQTYPRTLAAVLDSDPIARVNPASGATVFRHVIEFERRLVLIGDTIQAAVTADGILTPAKAIIQSMSRHEVAPHTRPFVVNDKLYLTSPKGATASGITEVGINEFTNNTSGEDLSTAAFRYLPAGIDRVAVCPVNYMAIYGVSGASDLYLHLFRYDNDQRIQNAFKRWHLPTGFTLGGMFFVNLTLYVLACKGGKGYVLKMDLSSLSPDADPSSTIQTYLDLKCSEAQVSGLTYDATANQTTLTLPYDRTDETVLVVRAPGTTAYPEGYLPAVDYDASATAGTTKLVVAGDLTSAPFYVGHKYTSIWTLSRLYPLDAKDKPLRNGRFNVRRISVDLASTGYIRAEVTAGGRPVQSYEYFGFTWDDPKAHYDQAPNATVRWEFPVSCENEQLQISLINDSPFGHSILGYEWVGEFNPRSQRT